MFRTVAKTCSRAPKAKSRVRSRRDQTSPKPVEILRIDTVRKDADFRFRADVARHVGEDVDLAR